jgi:hypothetical protein
MLFVQALDKIGMHGYEVHRFAFLFMMPNVPETGRPTLTALIRAGVDADTSVLKSIDIADADPFRRSCKFDRAVLRVACVPAGIEGL